MQKVKVDFSGLEDRSCVAPGRYIAVVKSVELKPGTNAPYIEWILAIADGTFKGLHVKHITSLSASALFNLRNTLTALGVTVPKSAVNLDLDAYIGKPLGIETFIEPYQGTDYAKVSKTFLPSALGAQSRPVAQKATATPSAELPFDEDDLDI